MACLSQVPAHHGEHPLIRAGGVPGGISLPARLLLGRRLLQRADPGLLGERFGVRGFRGVEPGRQRRHVERRELGDAGLGRERRDGEGEGLGRQ